MLLHYHLCQILKKVRALRSFECIFHGTVISKKTIHCVKCSTQEVSLSVCLVLRWCDLVIIINLKKVFSSAHKLQLTTLQVMTTPLKHPVPHIQS